ncbi:zinc finger protein 22-like [Ixodes scapularis]|nr:zinc finger protein 22-like [Ixodes scapularis]
MHPLFACSLKISQAALDYEWHGTNCEGTGVALSFQGVESQWQPSKMDQEGRADSSETSAPNLMVPTKITAPGWIEAYHNDEVDIFDRDSRRGDTSPQTKWLDPLKPQTHRQSDKHQCSFCPHSSYSATAVAIHEKTHTGERSSSCGVCKKTFTNKSNLVAHVRIHTGEKPFKCNTCSRAFTQKCNLVDHEKIHTGEKPFKCNTCSRAFIQKSKLANHERTHTREKPYRCETCSRAFASNSYLHNHRKIHRK